MPVPSTIGSLSTTASSNSPAGSESVFPDLDGYLRSLSAFIAQLHAGTNKPSWSAAGRIPYFDASGNYATTSMLGIDSSGNVGVGTTSPITSFDVSITGGATTSVRSGIGASAKTLYAGNGNTLTTQGLEIGQNSGGNAVLNNKINAPLLISTNNQLCITVDASAEATVALTHPLAPGGTSWKVGPNSAGAMIVYNQSSVGVYLTSGSTAWAANSDERIKTDLQPITDAAEKVASLRAVTGRYKVDAPGTSRAFLIAQDVQKVLPEAVDVQPDDAGTLGVRYTDVIPLLVAAIGELQARIKALEA